MHKVVAMCCAAAMMILAGCDPSQINSSDIARQGGSVKDLFGFYTWDSASSNAGHLISGVMRYETVNGPQDRYATGAYFYDLGGNPVTAASVTLNGTGVTDDDQQMRSFGTNHIWETVGGSNPDVPTFADTLPAPARFRIVSPAVQDTVSRSSGFTCTYTSPGTDSVYVFVEYNPSVSHIYDSTISLSATRKYTMAKVANTGSYTVSGSSISHFPNKGVIRVVVVAEEKKYKTANSRNYLMKALSATSVFAFIKS